MISFTDYRFNIIRNYLDKVMLNNLYSMCVCVCVYIYIYTDTHRVSQKYVYTFQITANQVFIIICFIFNT